MAHILEFRSNAERAELDCEPMLQRSAQIIIFPGVRIERHAEPVAEFGDRASGQAAQAGAGSYQTRQTRAPGLSLPPLVKRFGS